MRVVLDSNVVIAAAAARGLCEAVFELCLERHHIVACEGILLEVGRKLEQKLRLPVAVVEVIVSGDNNLLVLERFAEAKIVTPRAFWESMRNDAR